MFIQQDGDVIFGESGGKVGIGTSSPSADLHIGKTSGPATLKVDTSATADAGIQIKGYDAYVALGDATNGLQWYVWNDGPSSSSSLKFGSQALSASDWYADASQAMVITSSGNVGIGTTNPSGEFHVDSGLAPCDIHFTTGSTGGTGYDVNLNLTGGANNSEMNLNMGIAGNADREQIKTYQSTMRFTTADTERMQLDSSGNLYIGSGSQGAAINQARISAIHNTIPAARFAQGSTSNGLACVRIRHESTTAGNYIEFRTDENVLTGIIQDVSGTMQYQSASDSRLKENVESMSEGLTEVLAMNPVKFTWKDIVTENKTVDMEGAESRGFLAQELNEQYPWAVSEGGEDEKEKPWSVDYGKLTPVLVKAIQELKAELDAAKARITELEG